jgi:hypothetical protein
MNSTIEVTGDTGTYYGKELPEDACFIVKPDYEANDIVFYVGQNNEMMRINKEGFFWKGKLVENDKEIYQKFKEFLNKAIYE